ncbi:MAG: DUF4932 domain-containing protein [Chloroflexi bacterium]|nr:DUF4932 domain-containing protein [Chloroflexota bacterium]
MAPGHLDVGVDSRIELLSIVQFLSGYRLITQKDSLYRRNINHHFSPYKSHPAVKLFAELSKDFNYDAPPAAMLHLSEPPDLHLQLPFTEDLERRAGGKDRLEQFIIQLRDFARETRFMTFFEANQPILLPMVAHVRRQAQSCNVVRTVEDYFGSRQHSYRVILAPLLANNCFGLRSERSDNTYDVSVVVGGTMELAIKGMLIFSSSLSVSCPVLWHELSHSFVNPLTARFRAEIECYRGLYNPISNRMARIAYRTWEVCVNEHIIRAVTTRLIHREYGNVRGKLSLLEETMRGFRYVDALCARLQECELQRDQYPTFEDFYPQLVDVFRELSENGNASTRSRLRA